jgi:DNA-binding FadR family transcriptional regulator
LAIARAIRDRDPEAASAAMAAHLRTALDRLNAVFAGDARAAEGRSATTRQG